MELIWQIVIQLVLAMIMAALQAQKKPPASTQGDIDVPIVSETQPISFGYGTFKQDSPNLTWYGNFSTVEKTERVFFSEITIGYDYFLTQQYCLGFGECSLLSISMDDKEIWLNEGGIVGDLISSYKDNSFFNSDSGIFAEFTFYSGKENQTANEHLAVYNNLDINGFNNISSIVLQGEIRDDDEININPDGSYNTILNKKERGAKLGGAAVVKPMSFIMKRIPIHEELDQSLAEINGDCNPAFILYDIFTDDKYGINLDKELIDLESFKDCARKLYDEEFGLSFKYSDKFSCKDFKDSVCDHIGANIVTNAKTGQIKMILIREDYELEDLIEFNEDNIITMDKLSRTSEADLYNQVKVIYQNEDNNYQDAIEIYEDLSVTVNKANSNKVVVVEMPFIKKAKLAAIASTRKAVSLTTVLSNITFKCYKIHDLEEGDVILLNWKPLKLYNKPFRIQKINYGTIKSNLMTINAIQDSFSATTSTYSEEGDNKFIDIDIDAKPVNLFRFDSPRFFNKDYSSINTISFSEDDVNESYNLMIKEMESANYVNSGNGLFSQKIALFEDIDEKQTRIKIKNNLNSELSVKNSSEQESGENLLVILGTDGKSFEFITFEKTEEVNNELFLVNVKRGCLDTTPKAFNQYTLAALMSKSVTSKSLTFTENEELNIKAVSLSSKDQLPLENTPLINHTISDKFRFERPIHAANVKANDISIYDTIVLNLNQELKLKWNYRNLINQNKCISYFENSESSNIDNNEYYIVIKDIVGNVLYYITTTSNSFNFTEETNINPDGEYYDYLNVSIKTIKDSVESLEEQTFIITRSN